MGGVLCGSPAVVSVADGPPCEGGLPAPARLRMVPSKGSDTQHPALVLNLPPLSKQRLAPRVWLGPVLVCDTPHSPPPTPTTPPPRVLKDSGAGAMAPTAPNFFVPCLVEGGTMPLVLKTLKTFFPAKTTNRYYRIHTSTPPCPQTHTHTLEVCMW